MCLKGGETATVGGQTQQIRPFGAPPEAVLPVPHDGDANPLGGLEVPL